MSTMHYFSILKVCLMGVLLIDIPKIVKSCPTTEECHSCEVEDWQSPEFSESVTYNSDYSCDVVLEWDYLYSTTEVLSPRMIFECIYDDYSRCNAGQEEVCAYCQRIHIYDLDRYRNASIVYTDTCETVQFFPIAQECYISTTPMPTTTPLPTTTPEPTTTTTTPEPTTTTTPEPTTTTTTTPEPTTTTTTTPEPTTTTTPEPTTTTTTTPEPTTTTTPEPTTTTTPEPTTTTTTTPEPTTTTPEPTTTTTPEPTTTTPEPTTTTTPEPTTTTPEPTTTSTPEPTTTTPEPTTTTPEPTTTTPEPTTTTTTPEPTTTTTTTPEPTTTTTTPEPTTTTVEPTTTYLTTTPGSCPPSAECSECSPNLGNWSEPIIYRDEYTVDEDLCDVFLSWNESLVPGFDPKLTFTCIYEETGEYCKPKADILCASCQSVAYYNVTRSLGPFVSYVDNCGFADQFRIATTCGLSTTTVNPNPCPNPQTCYGCPDDWTSPTIYMSGTAVSNGTCDITINWLWNYEPSDNVPNPYMGFQCIYGLTEMLCEDSVETACGSCGEVVFHNVRMSDEPYINFSDTCSDIFQLTIGDIC